MIDKISGEDVVAIREELGLDQWQFADLLGVARLTVWQWEKGRRKTDGPASKLSRLYLQFHRMGLLNPDGKLDIFRLMALMDGHIEPLQSFSKTPWIGFPSIIPRDIWDITPIYKDMSEIEDEKPPSSPKDVAVQAVFSLTIEGSGNRLGVRSGEDPAGELRTRPVKTAKTRRKR